jgi:tRNA dimethylallyltransferase
MSSNHSFIPKTLIVIAGPTAVGKTAVSINLAKKLGVEIISADSRQFYKETVIGTASPGEKEMHGVKHYFIGNLSIHDYYNVSKYESDVNALLVELFKTSNKVIMTGGSGLYIDTVCKGIDDLPDPDPMLRQELNGLLKEKGISALQSRLKELDPDFYASADIKNSKRLIRAIEVCLQTGSTFTSLRKNRKIGHDFNIVKIGLNREKDDLLERISRRTQKMFDDGFMEEALALFRFRHLNALNTVGYKELFAYFDHILTLNEAVEKIKTNTWRYAKRQLTWFRRDKEYKWFHPDDEESILNYIIWQ